MGELKVDGGVRTTEELHAENVAKQQRGRRRARPRRPRGLTRDDDGLHVSARGRGVPRRSSGPGSTPTSPTISRATGSAARSRSTTTALARLRGVEPHARRRRATPRSRGPRSGAAAAPGVMEQVVYAEEMHRADAPGTLNPLGLSNIAPAIIEHGTDEQKRTLLPRMLRGDDIWCQGFSEPDAGLRPRVAAHVGGARRRRAGRQRTEDVEHARPPRELVRAARAHRSRARRSTGASRACSST